LTRESLHHRHPSHLGSHHRKTSREIRRSSYDRRRKLLHRKIGCYNSARCCGHLDMGSYRNCVRYRVIRYIGATGYIGELRNRPS
jgi:hypothetical protein